MIHSASTPPPSPPMARMAMVIGRCSVVVISSRRKLAFDPPLEEADHGVADARLELVPLGGVGDQRSAVERGAQHRGVAHLATQPAADAGIDHLGDGLAP